jgi:ketosteroid isomerase-like protein
MRRRACLIVVPLLLATHALAQAPAGKAPPERQTTATARTLIALENGWANGVVRRDTALFRRMLDPRFVYTEDASVMGKAEVIASIRDGDRVTEASNADMLVHDFGNTAIVTGILRLKGTAASGPFDRRYRFTDVWMRRNGAWRIIAAQDYLMPK